MCLWIWFFSSCGRVPRERGPYDGRIMYIFRLCTNSTSWELGRLPAELYRSAALIITVRQQTHNNNKQTHSVRRTQPVGVNKLTPPPLLTGSHPERLSHSCEHTGSLSFHCHEIFMSGAALPEQNTDWGQKWAANVLEQTDHLRKRSRKGAGQTLRLSTDQLSGEISTG